MLSCIRQVYLDAGTKYKYSLINFIVKNTCSIYLDAMATYLLEFNVHFHC